MDATNARAQLINRLTEISREWQMVNWQMRELRSAKVSGADDLEWLGQLRDELAAKDAALQAEFADKLEQLHAAQLAEAGRRRARRFTRG